MALIGIDTGGTFTDLVVQDGDSWHVYKILSTPDNPADAVIEGLKAIATAEPNYIVHGSTVATNAILERKGARTALITNKGFTDVLVIGRQNRSRLYDLTYRHESPLIPEALRFGVDGRIVHTGEELTPLDEAEAWRVAETIRESGVESVAVCFLFSFVNPAHELKMAEILAPLGISISLSHQILAEFREFERTSTTVINAYVRPRMQHYLNDITHRLDSNDRLRVMQSNGGCISADTAMTEPVRTILSGPAGGVVGAFEMGRKAGFDHLITFDMGGTSTDVSLINGRLPLTLESSIAGLPVKTPMIDIHTVGAGGGSIAGLDPGGSLFVGPESAVHSHMTNTLNTPIEALEFSFPFMITEYAIRKGTGGDGRYRGGDGLIREIRVLADTEVAIMSDRRKQSPYGLNHGKPGARGRNILIRNHDTTIMPGKFQVLMKAGDMLRIETPGGGGWGSSET